MKVKEIQQEEVMSDDQLIEMHKKTMKLEPSYQLRIKYYESVGEAPDDVLFVLAQAGSKKAKYTFMERYRGRLEEAPDEVVVLYAQEEECDWALDVLVKRYLTFVKKIIERLKRKGYFFKGMETADLVQEGIMGLFKSKNDFKIEKKTAFKDFSKHVIEKHMGTLILRSANFKNMVLNNSLSYHSPIANDSEITFEQMLKSNTFQPEETFVNKRRLKEIYGNLTILERKVLHLYVRGFSYEEIGEKVGKNTKAVDNTIQRIRTKGKLYLAVENKN